MEGRTAWALNRKLSPPLVVGTLTKLVEKMQADAINSMRTPTQRRDGELEGMPANSGRVDGVARVILDLADADRIGDEEIWREATRRELHFRWLCRGR